MIGSDPAPTSPTPNDSATAAADPGSVASSAASRAVATTSVATNQRNLETLGPTAAKARPPSTPPRAWTPRNRPRAPALSRAKLNQAGKISVLSGT